MSDFSRFLAESEEEPSESARMILRPITVGGAAPAPEVPLRTSVSGVVLDASAAVGPVVADFGRWAAPQLRRELVIMGDESGRIAPILREDIDNCGCPVRVLHRPRGGRALSLLAAVEDVGNEVVMVMTPGPTSFELITRALWWMWVEGADAALVPSADAVGTSVSSDGDAAVQLTEWLGLSGGTSYQESHGSHGGEGRLVLLRRWAARWLLSEIDRAIDPAEEVADRIRLLGIGIVQLCDTTALSASPLATVDPLDDRMDSAS